MRRWCVLHSIDPSAPHHVRQHARHAVLRSPRSANRTDPRSVASSTAVRRAWRSPRADIQRELDRRRPGTSRHVTQRREPDTVEILSGVFEGPHDGHADRALIRNEDSRSKDYANIADTFRPGHADYTYWQKYGIRDYRGGGRQSARETAVRVAAGAIAKKWLRERYGVAHPRSPDAARPERRSRSRAGSTSTPIRFSSPTRRWSPSSKRSWTGCASPAIRAARKSRSSRAACRWAGASRSTASSTPTSPRAMMGINAVKGVEIGAGFAAVAQRGTEHSDEMTPEGFLSNHAGGILGGISTGQDVRVAIAVKPTSSIRLDRHSIDKAGQSGDRQHAWPARPVRGHSRHADRRSDDGGRADGPCVAPSRAKRRCAWSRRRASRRRRRRRSPRSIRARRPSRIRIPDEA